jgi:hypothetical protein
MKKDVANLITKDPLIDWIWYACSLRNTRES